MSPQVGVTSIHLNVGPYRLLRLHFESSTLDRSLSVHFSLPSTTRNYTGTQLTSETSFISLTRRIEQETPCEDFHCTTFWYKSFRLESPYWEDAETGVGRLT